MEYGGDLTSNRHDGAPAFGINTYPDIAKSPTVNSLSGGGTLLRTGVLTRINAQARLSANFHLSLWDECRAVALSGRYH